MAKTSTTFECEEGSPKCTHVLELEEVANSRTANSVKIKWKLSSSLATNESYIGNGYSITGQIQINNNSSGNFSIKTSSSYWKGINPRVCEGIITIYDIYPATEKTIVYLNVVNEPGTSCKVNNEMFIFNISQCLDPTGPSMEIRYAPKTASNWNKSKLGIKVDKDIITVIKLTNLYERDPLIDQSFLLNAFTVSTYEQLTASLVNGGQLNYKIAYELLSPNSSKFNNLTTNSTIVQGDGSTELFSFPEMWIDQNQTNLYIYLFYNNVTLNPKDNNEWFVPCNLSNLSGQVVDQSISFTIKLRVNGKEDVAFPSQSNDIIRFFDQPNNDLADLTFKKGAPTTLQVNNFPLKNELSYLLRQDDWRPFDYIYCFNNQILQEYPGDSNPICLIEFPRHGATYYIDLYTPILFTENDTLKKGLIYIKSDGVWKVGVPYVKTENTWKTY